MRVFSDFYDLEFAPKAIKDFYEHLESKEFPMNESFMEYYGGKVYVIESPDELAYIQTSRESEKDKNEWANILETHDAFDDCRYIDDGKWVVIYLTTTNAGGHTYFIPRDIADKEPNVSKSIELAEKTQKYLEEMMENMGK